MSSSIRPPGAPPPASVGLDSLSELKAGQTTASQAPSTEGAGKGEPQGVETPTSTWLRRLSSGEVTREQAVEGLVAETVKAHGGQRLSAAQRAELSDVLRDALLGDPVLGELLGS